MGLSFWHLVLVLLVVFVLFGAGKLPQVMGDLGKGIRSLRDELKDDPSKRLTDQSKPTDDKNT